MNRGATPVALAIAACGAGWEPAALAEIERAADLELVRRCVDVADLLATAQTHRIDAALVAADAPGLDAGVVDRLADAGVATWTLDTGTTSHERQRSIGRPVRLGALAAIASAGTIEAPATAAGPAGVLVAVWGPTGAPGRSTLAVSVAAAAAARGRTTALVDADVHGGSIAQLLGILDDVSGVMAACRDANRGAGQAAHDHLLAVGPGLHVMTGIPRADMWHHLRPAAFESVLRRLLDGHDLVVVDCSFGADDGPPGGPWPDHVTRRVLDLADEVVVVGSADPVGLARLVRAVSDAGWLRAPRIVLNRWRPALGWTEREVASMVHEVTGTAPWGFLPHDQAAHDQAVMHGRPVRDVAPASGYVSRVDRLAAELAAPAPGVRPGPASAAPAPR